VPTYQYACTECGHRLEAVQSFSDEPLTVCPECAGRLRKVFNSVGIVFKGSGFYRTDSRANGKGEAKTDSKPTADSGSTSDSSTPSESRSKSDAKSDAKPSSSSATPSSSSATPAAA
jgi:putative FmdB family regulatory protein